ncbi:MAG: hypothetical protein GXP17_08455 [Gammaproteobacteria bacterium]|nr:hypothetical protein [Gammaproteobacteria bacterium]
MPRQDTLNAIAHIRKTLENFMVVIGILTGTILLIYFFTYGALVDSTTSSLIWFEVVTSVLMVLVLVFLKRVCFFLTRLKLGRRGEYQVLLAKMGLSDLALDEQALMDKLGGGK